ncbi:MAG: hypothetical protein ACJ763_17150 [Bdellovibrionia bacterium]
MRLRIFSALAALLVSFSALGVDMALIEKQLTTTGVEGWIHGGFAAPGYYVFTYRNPGDFFDYVEMSLITEDAAITRQLEGLKRHDKIRVKGEFLKNPSPQKHIKAHSIEVIQTYQNPYPMEDHIYGASVPADLARKSSAPFLVHAVAGDGHILVVEYNDVVLPVYVKNAKLAQGLFRGDIVELKFRVRDEPDQPLHLSLEEKDPEPLKVIESIRSIHGKKGTIEGALILFPKSPEILFNVFAVQQLLPTPSGELSRQFTLVNFDSPEEFAKIRKKLQNAWDRYSGEYTNGRNKLVSKVIRVKATGTFNEVSENQANPQILLDSADSIEITTVK